MNFKSPGFYHIIAFLIIIAPLFPNAVQAGNEASPISIRLEETRNAGYSLGDEITLIANIEAPYFYKLESALLPKPGPFSDWLELKSIRFYDNVSDFDYRLIITYQIFKGVKKTVNLSIPPLPLHFSYGGSDEQAEIPAWSFSYHPQIAPETPDNAVAIQKELPAPFLDNSGEKKWALIFLALILFLMIYIGWLYGKIPFLERYSGAFGKASRTLAEILREPYSEENYRKALQCFHHALNEINGGTVFYEQLDDFFQRYPAYMQTREQTERLFRISHDIFFAAAEIDPVKLPLTEIAALCQACRKIERGSRWA